MNFEFRSYGSYFPNGRQRQLFSDQLFLSVKYNDNNMILRTYLVEYVYNSFVPYIVRGNCHLDNGSHLKFKMAAFLSRWFDG